MNLTKKQIDDLFQEEKTWIDFIKNQPKLAQNIYKIFTETFYKNGMTKTLFKAIGCTEKDYYPHMMGLINKSDDEIKKEAIATRNKLYRNLFGNMTKNSLCKRCSLKNDMMDTSDSDCVEYCDTYISELSWAQCREGDFLECPILNRKYR